MYRTIIIFILVALTSMTIFFVADRKAATHYSVPKEYTTFANDAKFNFKKINVNYPYFITHYGLNLRRIIAESSYEGEKLVEGSNLFANISVLTTPVHFENELTYLGENRKKQHVYTTHVYLHVSIYESYKFSFLDVSKEYILDLGESEIFTTVSPETYKERVPNLVTWQSNSSIF